MNTYTEEHSSEPWAAGARRRSGVSGRRVVLAMLVFGLSATGIMWIYWELHLTPFMPLQEALVAEFDDSSPRVSGGQRKISRNTPRILRVVMRMPFDPTAADQETAARIQHVLQRVRELADQHVERQDYEVLEVHLFQEIQHPTQNEIRSEVFRKDLDTWQDLTEAQVSSPRPN